MMKQIALLSFSCFLIACQPQKDKGVANLITGDWVAPGYCPVMYLQIDSLQNIRFYGDRHTSITGGYSGRITEKEYNSIIDKIRNLPIDSLRPLYEAPLTDQATMGIAIVHGNKVIRSSAYGHDQEPMELRILFGKLINLYRHTNLKQDTSVNEAYFINNPNVIQMILSPPPPPVSPAFRPPQN